MLSNKQGPAASDAWHTSGMGRALMLAVAALVVLPTAAPAAATAPTLVVVDQTPLTIRGRGFATDRDVTVIVRTPTMTERRTLRPDALGSFRLEVVRLKLTGSLRCGVGVVIAAQVTGRNLVLWHQNLPNCAAPLRPSPAPA